MRVLLVEDEAGVARFIRKGLEEEGYAVRSARAVRRKVACISRLLPVRLSVTPHPSRTAYAAQMRRP
jgi:CheY-like chemotaxis protein